jgi:flavin reductase (DIM6/NTAB) family NADH-FMN oxidoreductase RutF
MSLKQPKRIFMSKITFQKPGNFIYPVPAVMVSLRDAAGKTNILTVAWTGTVCTDPPMAYISVRHNRASYEMLKESREFVINLPDESLCHAMDYCGVRSGAKVDKWKEMHLTEGKSTKISAPTIEEAPVSIECRVREILPLGTHDMFLADVVAIQVDEKYIDEKGAFHMDQVGLLAYSHGEYYALGKQLGFFGYSVQKKNGVRAISRKPASGRSGEKNSGTPKAAAKNSFSPKAGSAKKANNTTAKKTTAKSFAGKKTAIKKAGTKGLRKDHGKA